MNDAEARHGAQELVCGSWINNHPAFLRNFPRDYTDNAGPQEKEIRWGDGFWGQFTNARGCFNDKLGAYFRNTGELRYWRRTCWCSIAALRVHLQTRGTTSYAKSADS